MDTYAVIESGIVVNTILWDGLSDWTPPPESIAVDISGNPGVSIGYTYAGGVFSAPA